MIKTVVTAIAFLVFGVFIANAQNLAISLDHIDVMRDAGVKVRFPSCPNNQCERIAIPDGITPDELLETDTLDFNGQRLTRFPPWIQLFSHIKTLNISNANMNFTEFEKIHIFSNLEILNISNIYLERQDTNSKFPDIYALLGTFPKLKFLDVSNNPSYFDFNSAQPGLFKRIVHLNLNGTCTGKLKYFEMPMLEQLDISGKNYNCYLVREYEDLFALPRLKIFNTNDRANDGSNSTVISRVKKRANKTDSSGSDT